jgi:hypothetical protein
MGNQSKGWMDRMTDRWTIVQMCKHLDIFTDRLMDILTVEQMDRQTNRWIDRQTDGQTDKQMDRHTNRWTDRQTVGQTDIYKYTCGQTERWAARLIGSQADE